MMEVVVAALLDDDDDDESDDDHADEDDCAASDAVDYDHVVETRHTQNNVAPHKRFVFLAFPKYAK